MRKVPSEQVMSHQYVPFRRICSPSYLENAPPADTGIGTCWNHLTYVFKWVVDAFVGYEPNPRYENVQVELVGTSFTPRSPQALVYQPDPLSYYMKGKSEWAEQ